MLLISMQCLIVLHAADMAIAGCFHPAKRVHTQISISDKDDDGLFPENTTISYKCDRGYELLNNQTRQCLSNGTWSGNEPFCGVNVIKSAIITKVGTNKDGTRTNSLTNGKCTTKQVREKDIFIVELKKTFITDVMFLKLQVNDFVENSAPEIRISSSYNVQSINQDFNDYTIAVPMEKTSEKIHNLSYVTFQYQFKSAISSKTISFQANWKETKFRLCNISLYYNLAIPEEWCATNINGNSKHMLYGDKCYVVYGGNNKSNWSKAKELCQNESQHNSSLAKFAIDSEIYKYIYSSISDNGDFIMKDYWTMDSVNNSNCPSVSMGDTFTFPETKSCDDIHGRICEYDIPCGTPDQMYQTVMNYSEQEAEYFCPKNIKLLGSSVRRCFNGKWTLKAPACLSENSNESDILTNKEKEIIIYIITTTVNIVSVIIIVQWIITGLIILCLKKQCFT